MFPMSLLSALPLNTILILLRLELITSRSFLAILGQESRIGAHLHYTRDLYNYMREDF